MTEREEALERLGRAIDRWAGSKLVRVDPSATDAEDMEVYLDHLASIDWSELEELAPGTRQKTADGLRYTADLLGKLVTADEARLAASQGLRDRAAELAERIGGEVAGDGAS